MKKRLLALYVCIVAVALAMVLFGCKQTPEEQTTPDDYLVAVSRIEKSLPAVKVADASLVATDQGVTVYEYRRTVTVYAEDNVMVNTTERKLGSNFAFETTTDSESLDSIDRTKLLGLDLTRANVGEVSVEQNTVRMAVSKENLAKVCGQDVAPRQDTQIVFTFEEEKLASAAMSVWTTGGRYVTIEVSYTY